MRINRAYVRRLEDIILRLSDFLVPDEAEDYRELSFFHKEADRIRDSRKARDTVRRGQTNKGNSCPDA